MKKHIVKILFTVGILLVSAAFAIAVIKTLNTNIIGGAGMPTLIYMISGWKGGLCSYLALLGIGFVIASVVVKIINRKMENI